METLRSDSAPCGYNAARAIPGRRERRRPRAEDGKARQDHDPGRRSSGMGLASRPSVLPLASTESDDLVAVVDAVEGRRREAEGVNRGEGVSQDVEQEAVH